MGLPGALRRFLARVFGNYADSRRRRHLAFGAAGALLAASGLLTYVLLLPEEPFAQTPTTLIRDARPGDAVKVFGTIDCTCQVAVNYSEEQVGFTARKPRFEFVPFSLDDRQVVLVDSQGNPVSLSGKGWDHFRVERGRR